MNEASTLKQELKTVMDKHFTQEEIRDLCFDLDVDYDNLAGETKAGKIRELILYMARDGRLEDLIKRVRRMRPNAELPGVWSEDDGWDQIGWLDVLADEAVLLDFMAKGEQAVAQAFVPMRELVDVYSSLTPKLNEFGARMTSITERAQASSSDPRKAQVLLREIRKNTEELSAAMRQTASSANAKLARVQRNWQRVLDVFSNVINLLSPYEKSNPEVAEALQQMIAALDQMSSSLGASIAPLRSVRHSLHELETLSGSLGRDLHASVQAVAMSIDGTIQVFEEAQTQTVGLRRQAEERIGGTVKTEEEKGMSPLE